MILQPMSASTGIKSVMHTKLLINIFQIKEALVKLASLP